MTMRKLIEAVAGQSELDTALQHVAMVKSQLEEAQSMAEEFLTRWFEKDLQAMAARMPQRKFEASSGMGSLSVSISDRNGKDSYVWIWNSQAPGPTDWKSIWRRWENLLDDFSDKTGIEYVNFTRDVVIEGAQYRGG